MYHLYKDFPRINPPNPKGFVAMWHIFSIIKLELTPCSGFGQQLLHDIVVSRFIGHPRILHQLLLDRNANIVVGQQIFEFFKSLQNEIIKQFYGLCYRNWIAALSGGLHALNWCRITDKDKKTT